VGWDTHCTFTYAVSLRFANRASSQALENFIVSILLRKRRRSGRARLALVSTKPSPGSSTNEILMNYTRELA